MKLYRKREKTFPSRVEADGKLYHIDADYRNILRIFAVLKDAKVPEEKRVEKLIQWFFAGADGADLPHEAAIKAFLDFVNPPDESESMQVTDDGERDGDDEKRFDYDFDAEEIYAGFLSEYGIDLVEVEFLHWCKFKILLGNLSGESAFRKKIELRFMDLSGFTGQHLAGLSKAKESVQLPVEYSEDELRDMREFESVWGNL